MAIKNSSKLEISDTARLKKYYKSIKKRDNYECQNKRCKEKLDTPLTVHHIDKNRGNIAPWNLITLCLKCATMAKKKKKPYKKVMADKYPNNWKDHKKWGA